MKKNKTFFYTRHFQNFSFWKCVLKFTFILIPLLFTATACNDNIFYTISKEVRIKEPLIKGSPTNFVVFNGDMYVASGKILHIYSESGEWSKKSLDEKIIHLAATSAGVYALCYIDKEKSTPQKIFWISSPSSDTARWVSLPGITEEYNLQSIYSADDKLYFGAKKNDEDLYDVLVYDGNVFSSFLVKGEKADAILYGVVSDSSTTFLCTGKGIYTSDGVLKDSKDKSDFNFIGIIKHPDCGTIAAITRAGALYKIDAVLTDAGDHDKFILTDLEVTFGSEREASGAIALWKDKDDPLNQLLLVGRKEKDYSISTGYTYGYLELKLEFKDDPDTTDVIEENLTFDKEFKTPSTIDDERYSSSIGVIPINHLFQAPNGILFASTQQKGVWSYKEHDDGSGKKKIMWNSEND